MAKTAINIIKKWFKTGSKPTQDQFWSWQDSYWHKDEIIPQENIQNLSTTLSSKADADQLANKANADASGMTDLQAQAWATLLKPHLPTSSTYTKTEINEKLGKITFRTIVDDNGSTYVPQPISFLQMERLECLIGTCIGVTTIRVIQVGLTCCWELITLLLMMVQITLF